MEFWNKIPLGVSESQGLQNVLIIFKNNNKYGLNYFFIKAWVKPESTYYSCMAK